MNLGKKKFKDWDAVELGTLLNAYIVEILGEDLDKIDFAGYEYCQENGQYVSYKLA